jgi:hypothetical protein
MGTLLSIFCERHLVDYKEKADSNFEEAIRGSWLGGYRDLAPHFAIFHTLPRNANIMVRIIPVWAPY